MQASWLGKLVKLCHRPVIRSFQMSLILYESDGSCALRVVLIILIYQLVLKVLQGNFFDESGSLSIAISSTISTAKVKRLILTQVLLLRKIHKIKITCTGLHGAIFHYFIHYIECPIDGKLNHFPRLINHLSTSRAALHFNIWRSLKAG